MSGLFAWLVVLIIASVTAHYWEKYAREKAGQENWAEDKLWDEERDYEVLPKTICYIVQPITIIVGVIWLWGAMLTLKMRRKITGKTALTYRYTTTVVESALPTRTLNHLNANRCVSDVYKPKSFKVTKVHKINT